MSGNNHVHPPGFFRLLHQLAATGIGTLQNRSELLSVEWQEERARRVGFITATFVCLFMSGMALALVTAIVIFLFREEWRLYVAGVFAFLYAAGALWAGLGLKSLLGQAPFSESLNQLKKDREWLESSFK
jgi:uncharacterized membrane protein YqjE